MVGDNFNKFEIKRKLFHIFVGIAIVFLVYQKLLTWWFVLTMLLIAVILSVYYKNSQKKSKIPILDFFLKQFDRPEHIENFPAKGVIFLLLGLLVLLLLFEKNIVIASILIWTFGDSFSAVIGKHYGKYKNPFNDKRLVEGTIAGIIFGCIAASFFVEWYFALPAAFIAMIIESLELSFCGDIVDDNFLVPVISAITLTLLI